MSAMEMVRQWQDAVKVKLLPVLHGHQAKALAQLSWAMAASGSCGSGAIAARLPTAVRPASTRRRLERTLANERLDAPAAMLQLTRSLLRDWGGRKLLLILDETPKGEELCCMKLSVAYRKRAVTLLSICYAPGHAPMPMPKLVRWMLQQVAACLPPDVVVTLLADRQEGFALPADYAGRRSFAAAAGWAGTICCGCKGARVCGWSRTSRSRCKR